MKICIIVPVYNEEKILKNSIETIMSYAIKLPVQTKIVVVNDGSTDTTEIILAQLKAIHSSFELEVISHAQNKGYGAAQKTGIRFAVEEGFDYIIFMDSDLTNHPKYLQKFYEKMAEGFDYIKATRYAKGGAIASVPLQHRILSIMGNLLARILYRLPLTDFTNGFRAVKVEVLKKMDLKEPGFSIIMEELYYAKRLAKSFCEIHYVLTSRRDGQGKSKFSYSPRTCFRYLKYPIKSFLRDWGVLY